MVNHNDLVKDHMLDPLKIPNRKKPLISSLYMKTRLAGSMVCKSELYGGLHINTAENQHTMDFHTLLLV